MKYPLALIILVGCTAPAAPDVGPKAVHLRFCGEDSFTDSERASVEAATVKWRTFSDGIVDTTVEWGCKKGPMIHRLLSTDLETVVVETQLAKLRGMPDLHLYGWQTGNPFVVSLVVDVPTDLRLLAQHELGHAAGLRWPGCDDTVPKNHCHHIPERGHLMSEFWSGNDFDDTDRAFCRASRLCR